MAQFVAGTNTPVHTTSTRLSQWIESLWSKILWFVIMRINFNYIVNNSFVIRLERRDLRNVKCERRVPLQLMFLFIGGYELWERLITFVLCILWITEKLEIFYSSKNFCFQMISSKKLNNLRMSLYFCMIAPSVEKKFVVKCLRFIYNFCAKFGMIKGFGDNWFMFF